MISSPFILLPLQLLLQNRQAAADGGNCEPSSCGNIPIIKNPFRLATDLQICGDYNYNYYLSCESNTTILYLRDSSARFYVQAINYNNLTIRVVDDGVFRGNCSSFPATPLSLGSFNLTDSPYTTRRKRGNSLLGIKIEQLDEVLTLISCENAMVSSAMFMEIAPCIDQSRDSSPYYYYYAVIDGDRGGVDLFSLGKKCKVEMMTLLPAGENYSHLSFQQLQQQFKYGFHLSWHRYKCTHCYGVCSIDSHYNAQCYNGIWILAFLAFLVFLIYVLRTESYTFTVTIIGHLSIKACGMPVAIIFLIYKWRRRHLSAYNKIEEYIQNQNFMPIRYSYSNIQNFTDGFKDKLGEGGFGSVYKAKLRSGSFAAVKMLGNSTAGGVQDFINEVATIGTIHHANVVKLIGFCSEGSKRALVYEFMPNGSLDKYIFHKQQGRAKLSLEQLYRISIGVAQGIEYLHSGCAMQILHFDIKPHNVLLDDNFNPKLSDFGLARLYYVGDRVATLTAARGTIEYMVSKQREMGWKWCAQARSTAMDESSYLYKHSNG